MAQPARVRAEYRTTVLRADRITPAMVRLVLGGRGLDAFVDLPCTDHYVKVVIPGDDEHPPVLRTYTVRAWDPEVRELTIDFVVHGDAGRAGPWSARVQPGAEVVLQGQGGGFVVAPERPWVLLAGDESALPAILATLERLPAGVPATAFIEVADAAEEQPVVAPGADVRWVHRGSSPYGACLVRDVRAFVLPDGAGQVFLHGEAGMVRELRRHVRRAGVELADLSASGYWRLGRDDEAWREEKAEWKAAVSRDEEALHGT